MREPVAVQVVGQVPNTAEFHKGRVEWASRHLKEAHAKGADRFVPECLDLYRILLCHQVQQTASHGSREHHIKTSFALYDAESEAALKAMLLDQGYTVDFRPFSRGSTAGLGF